MQHEIPVLDAKGLRRFGLTTGAIVAVLFGVLLPWLLGAAWPLWPWLVAGVLGVWALIAPAYLDRVYHGWMRLGMLLGLLTTPIVLGVVFYLVVTPVALGMKVFGRDPLKRRFERDAASYRVPSERPPPERLERPF
jgi:hypothetical protein